VHVERGDALRWLAKKGQSFDIIFLDPPFSEDMLAVTCPLLVTGHWLAPMARVYLETPVNRDFPPLPESWHLVRDKRAGQVRYALAETSNELGKSD
jgi:16S rRNA (guanine966-N2)-methyltransferase